MLLFNKKLSISPITTHVDIKDISKKINSKNIIGKIFNIHKWFKKYQNIFLKLQYSDSIHTMLNSKKLRRSESYYSYNKKLKKKLKIQGPFSSDTFKKL